MEKLMAKLRNSAPSRSVFNRLLTGYSVILLVSVLFQATLTGQQIQRDALTRAQDQLAGYCAQVAQSYQQIYPTQWEMLAAEIALQRNAQQWGVSIWRVNSSGGILAVYNPLTDAQQLGTALTREEVTQALAPVMGGKTFVSTTLFNSYFDAKMLSVGAPLYGWDGAINGAVFVHLPQSSIRQGDLTAYNNIWIWALVMLGAGGMLFLWMADTIAAPLAQMNTAVTALAKGHYGNTVPVTTQDEVGQLAENFNKMADELRRQEEVRKGFVGNVSHELRAPLAAVQGYVQGLIDGVIPPEESAEYLQIVLDEAKRMNRLISDLLDLSKIEAGKFPMNMTVFELNGLVSRVVLGMQARIEEKGMDMEVSFQQNAHYVRADVDRIGQVLYNLIDNAVKFSPPGGRISIWVHPEGNRVMVSVADEGKGIESEDLDQLFDRFFKGDRAHSGGGAGLGLAIVKTIIEQHQQQITVRSSPGHGARFTFSLQAARASEMTTPPAHQKGNE